jgi:hypothetical protein
MEKIIHRKTIRKTPLTIDGVHLSCEHGLKIYLVDGTQVRNHLDSDFVSGSGLISRFIPRSEIWIDASISKDEIHFLVENECILAEATRSGLSIEKACAKAQRAEEASRRTEKVAAPEEWKVPTGERCEHGLEIFLVDGTHVRDTWDSSFIQGGNEFRYDFVPKNELWVEASIPDDEKTFVLFHECFETEKMRQGWGYDRAHAAAKRAENKMRRRSLA